MQKNRYGYNTFHATPLYTPPTIPAQNWSKQFRSSERDLLTTLETIRGALVPRQSGSVRLAKAWKKEQGILDQQLQFHAVLLTTHWIPQE